ncbi:MAG: helix-turn-helix domain-containing protein [Propionibacteriaceae bacterium]|nr:helix-turn-helix domain-containing protein [Propionibacteriaceae bacterium]
MSLSTAAAQGSHAATPAALSPEEAGRYLGGLAAKTLANWRVQGQGPAYVRAGGKNIVYRIVDLDAWLAQNRVGGDAG